MLRKMLSLCFTILIIILSSTSYSQEKVEKVMTIVPKPSKFNGWRICNYSGEPKIWAAICYYDGSRWVKRGWFTIQPGMCNYVLNSLVPNHKLYLYAESRNVKWHGKKPLCAHPYNKFTHYGDLCDGGYRVYNYIEFSPGNNTGWETNLTR